MRLFLDFCGNSVRKRRDENQEKPWYDGIVESCEVQGFDTKGKEVSMPTKTKKEETGERAPSGRHVRTVFLSRTDCEEKLASYFDVYLPESGEVADIESLADFLGTTRDDLTALMEHKTYGLLLKRAKNRIAKIKKQLAFHGKLPAAVLSFDLKNNHGYKDRPEEQHDGSGNTVVFRGKAEDWAK